MLAGPGIQNLFSTDFVLYRMCSLYGVCLLLLYTMKLAGPGMQNVFSTECVLYMEYTCLSMLAVPGSTRTYVDAKDLTLNPEP